MKTIMRRNSGPTAEKVARQIEHAREALARKWRGTDEVRNRLVNLALGEAAALAWNSGVPQLVFPSLAAEKVAALNRWYVKQDRIRRGQPADAPAEGILQLTE